MRFIITLSSYPWNGSPTSLSNCAIHIPGFPTCLLLQLNLHAFSHLLALVSCPARYSFFLWLSRKTKCNAKDVTYSTYDNAKTEFVASRHNPEKHLAVHVKIRMPPLCSCHVDGSCLSSLGAVKKTSLPFFLSLFSVATIHINYTRPKRLPRTVARSPQGPLAQGFMQNRIS